MMTVIDRSKTTAVRCNRKNRRSYYLVFITQSATAYVLFKGEGGGGADRVSRERQRQTRETDRIDREFGKQI